MNKCQWVLLRSLLKKTKWTPVGDKVSSNYDLIGWLYTFIYFAGLNIFLSLYKVDRAALIKFRLFLHWLFFLICFSSRVTSSPWIHSYTSGTFVIIQPESMSRKFQDDIVSLSLELPNILNCFPSYKEFSSTYSLNYLLIYSS